MIPGARKVSHAVSIMAQITALRDTVPIEVNPTLPWASGKHGKRERERKRKFGKDRQI